MSQHEHINELTAHLFRENSGKMVAVLSRMFGLSHIETVMDIVQDTFETALTRWRFSGIPENPSGWLMTVARNKALNAVKREGKTENLDPLDIPEPAQDDLEKHFDILVSPGEIRDSQLRLLLTCCQPSFSAKNQVMITLYVLCGFGVPEIANALLMKEEAVKKALTRSKTSLRNTRLFPGRAFVSPKDERIATARTIVYLMFNEGYKTTRSQQGIDNDLCFEAIRLAKLLENDAGEQDSQTNALLALMFLTLSRFPERQNGSGEWLTLEEQDRSRWDPLFIEEGYHYLNKASTGEDLSRYHLEALISSLHCTAQRFADTDWKRIGWLYRQLEIMEPSPMVTLNRIIAESYLPGSNSIAELDQLKGEVALKNSFLLPAAKGEIHRRKGEPEKAQVAYTLALELAVSPADKQFLKKKITECLTHKPN